MPEANGIYHAPDTFRGRVAAGAELGANQTRRQGLSPACFERWSKISRFNIFTPLKGELRPRS